MAETMVAPVTVASLETVVEEEDDQQEQPVGEKIDESRIEPPNAPPVSRLHGDLYFFRSK